MIYMNKKVKTAIIHPLILIIGLTLGYQWSQYTYTGACADLGGERANGNHNICVIEKVVKTTAAPQKDATKKTNIIIDAAGTEPFWSFEYKDGFVTWTVPSEDASGSVVNTKIPAYYEQGDSSDITRLVGVGKGSFRAEMQKKACSDGMSERNFTHALTVRFQGTEYHGCANLK